jgi:hypothetical protein
MKADWARPQKLVAPEHTAFDESFREFLSPMNDAALVEELLQRRGAFSSPRTSQ